MDDNKPYIYVHCFDSNEFHEYQTANPAYNCVYLIDGNSIRGRVEGKVVRLDRSQFKWNDQEIEESIAIQEAVWNKESPNHSKSESETEEDFSYGV